MVFQRILWCVFLCAVVFLCGCSSLNHNPIDAENAIVSSSPTDTFDNQTNRIFLGKWNVLLDIDNLSVKTTQHRELENHVDVTALLPPPFIQINSYNPATGIIDIDISITNPYSIIGYDFRAIIYSDDAGHKLMNADDWTGLYDIPGGLPINPFIAFGKDEIKRKFDGQSQQTENMQIYLPGGDSDVSFAFDVSYPTNCLEPYEITDFFMGQLFEIAGSTAETEIFVRDWQSNVDTVKLFCPQVLGDELLPFDQETTEKWVSEITNSNQAEAGEYSGYLIATSSNSGTLALYDEVTILVRPSCPKYDWALTWGGEKSEYTYDLVTDDLNNIYITGIFAESVDFDPGAGIDIHNSVGGNDAFLLKLNSNGDFIWARTWGSTSNDTGWGIEIDSSDNVYVTGAFQNSVDFDPGAGEDIQESNGGDDPFISKFDKDGNFVWARTWGGEDTDKSYDIVIDGFDNISIVGYFWNTADFNPDGGDTHSTVGRKDAYISRFDSSGNYHWMRNWGSINDDEGKAITADSYSNIYVTGIFVLTADFDPGGGIDYHTSNGGYDIFLSKFDSAGNLYWAKTWGGTENTWDVPTKIVTDANEDLYMVGHFKSSVIDFDPGSGVDEHYNCRGGYYDAFLCKFNPSGYYQWAKTWGGNESDFNYDVAVDSNNLCYSLGNFDGTVDLDPGPADDFRTSTSGNSDNNLSCFDTDGNYIYAVQWDRGGYTFDIDPNKDLFIGGGFSGTVNFAPAPEIDLHTSNGQNDCVLIKFIN